MTTTATHECGICGAPSPDGSICHDDTATLGHDLRLAGGWFEHDPRSPIGRRWVHGLLHELLTTGARLDVTPRTSPENHDDALTLDSRYPVVISEAPSPANLAALNAHHTLTRVIADLARAVLPHVTDRPARGYMTIWLTDHLDVIRRHPHAPDLATRLQRAVQRAETLIQSSRAPFTIACTCGHRIPIDPASTELIRCRCGQWGTLQWWIDNHAPAEQTNPMPLAELHTWLLSRGVNIGIQAVRQWTKRPKPDGTYHLPDTGRDDRGRRLYDPTGALDVAQRMTSRTRP